MVDNIRQYALSIYKKNPVSNWILGLTTGIIGAALIALDLVIPGLVIVVFPFLIIPIYFSAHLSHVLLKTNMQITFGKSMRNFGTYYRGEFFGSYSIWRSIIKSLLVFLITEMTLSFIVSTIFYTLSDSFTKTVETFYQAISSESITLEDMNAILMMNDGVLFKYICIVVFPSLYLAILFFIYNLSRNSITIYYRMHSRNTNARYIRLMYADVLRHQRWPMLRAYVSLNWPFYLLLALGFAGGTVGGYFWDQSILTMLTCGFIGGATLSVFFLPFYFGNQEALYDTFAGQFKQSTSNIATLLLRSLQENIDMSIEEKDRLEKSLENNGDILEDEAKDDNKKDPDGP